MTAFSCTLHKIISEFVRIPMTLGGHFVMPANLPPEYQKAEAAFRAASTHQEKIEALQVMLRVIPHHKGTDKLIAQHRKKLSHLRDESERRTATSRKGSGVTVPKEGAAQVILVGMPNSGKSSLVAQLTRATPEVAPYPFTTQLPTPGMMPYLNIKVQLVDTSPLTFDPARSWLPNLIRSANALLLVASLAEDPLKELETSLEILGGWKIFPEGAEKEAADPGIGAVFMPALVMANKIDTEGAAENLRILKELYAGLFPVCAISAETGLGLEDMKPKLFDLLHICRVYTKSPGKPPDLNDPVILPLGGTVEDFAGSIHKDLKRRMKFARIWGSAKFDGQKVTREYVVRDEDIVELHT